MLVVSLILMGAGTVMIGLLPTYDQVGALAPLLLVAARLLQGLAVGGEWGGAVLIAVEHAPKGKRGLYGSAPQIGVPLGLLLATGAFYVASLLPKAEFLSWGWRIPFLASSVLILVGIYIRLRLAEAPAFQRVRETNSVVKYPVWEVFRRNKKQVLIGVCANGTANVPFYIASVFVLSYGSKQLELSRNAILGAVMIAAAADVLTLPIAAGLSDKFGRRPMLIFGSAFFAVFAFPFFWLVDTGSLGLITVALLLVFAVGHASTYGIVSSFLSELFDVRIRYSGSSAAYQLAGVVWSAPAPFIAAALFAWTGSSWSISLYILLVAIFTIGAVWLSPETHHKELDGEWVQGYDDPDSDDAAGIGRRNSAVARNYGAQE